MKSLSAACLLCALALAGCTLGPDYRTPDSAIPARFQYQDGWRTMPEQPWVAQGTWWEAFDDPVLTDLIEQADQASQTLAQAEARFRAAEAQWRLARGEYSPQLDASVSGTRSGGSDTDPGNLFSGRLDISWAPDLWGRVRRQVEAERAGLAASAADIAAARLTLQVAVVQGYVRIRALDRQRAILELTMAAYDRSAELTRNQYNAGIVSRSDVIQAETQRQSLRTQLYDLQQQRAQEENALAALLGVAPVSFSIAATNALPLLPALPAALPSVLIARRPDVVVAERGVAQANALIGVAQTAWLPDLTLSAYGALQDDTFSGLFDAPQRIWSVGPSLALTLFDGGRRRATRDIAVAQYDEQVANYRQTILDSLRDVEDALATMQVLREKAEQQDELLALAEQNESVIANRYRAGMVSFLEVATAQNLTLEARRSRLDITSQQLQAAAELAAAIGGGWDLDDPVIQRMARPEPGE
ncbi:efflux transporter outer membrane subunit [Alcanivorax sp. 24]|uniref:efflux transporter outer membrane subunit n=1 Tax=Alcanivorax sp. 24 TaxID=2545266 RepID=UPI00105D35E1|nr:efflux transporter outer membrane subunit [Alcanivorax sp. 24]